ncbi:Crp/Fnr family transcriptional regulator, partial [Methylobacterium oxalidis]|uniref:Crp/Fnr family transcriptional regulator n=1 Tax=Methylobacterium oxalidis TaxID=944322 RepID=UPI003315E17F
GDSCLLPVTQVELGDATGLSNVHVNRVLQELRSRGLIVLRGNRLTIPDLGALQQVSLFNVNYLHLDREGHYLDANGPEHPSA